MTKIALKVNGKPVSADVEDRMLLVQFIREELHLTGTHVGCDTSQCGACVVHVDGKAVKSCTILVGQADGTDIKTIEGLATGDMLHPVQVAFREYHGLQCGFCTPGMIMTAVDMISRYDGHHRTEGHRRADDAGDADVASSFAGADHAGGTRSALFGRNALQTASCVSM